MLSVSSRQRWPYRAFVIRPSGDFSTWNWQHCPCLAATIRSRHNDRSLVSAIVLTAQWPKGGAV